jgi:hypothetical protein
MKKSIRLFVTTIATISGLLIACNVLDANKDVELRVHHGIFATYSSKTKS